jgi:hypothetical protein
MHSFTPKIKAKPNCPPPIFITGDTDLMNGNVSPVLGASISAFDLASK